MAPCTIFLTVNHSLFILNVKWPHYYIIISIKSTSVDTSGGLVVLVTAPTTLTEAQYTPAPPQSTSTTLSQQSIDYGSITRQRVANAAAQSTNRAAIARSTTPKATYHRFTVRISYASYTDSDPPMTKYTVWSEGWSVGLFNNSVATYAKFKDTLRAVT